MNNNAILRSSLLYFTDEAIGYRHSLHLFNRWLETGSQEELELMIIEVGREHYIDLRPIIDCVNGKNVEYGYQKLIDIIGIKGIYVPKEWVNEQEVKLTPIPKDIFNTADYTTWFDKINSITTWVSDNNGAIDNPLSVIKQAICFLDGSKENFYQIFNLLEMLFGYDTLFSCVINDDIKLLGKVAGNYYAKQGTHIGNLASAISTNTDLNWRDALSRNQIKSKAWLLDKLETLKLLPKKRQLTEPATTTVIAGGWVGILPLLAEMSGKNLDTVINFDIDTSVHPAARELNLNTHNSFKNSNSDITTVDFTKYKKLLVIDTIVEHFENHGEWVASLPKGTIVVLQGNDMFDVPDHVNCHSTLEEFLETCGLNTIIWAGELYLYKCKRFMAIGKV